MAQTHKHLIVTGYTNFKTSEDSVEVLNDWFVRLVDKVDMNILIDPKSVYCDTEGNEGLTGLVCIDTSHSTIHFWDGFFKFDLYSCKEFDKNDVFELLGEFETLQVAYTMIDRTDDAHPVIASGTYTY